MGEKIKIKLSDWQFNAGIVGICNILEHAEEEVIKKDQHIEVKLEALENFSEKYFDYFIEKYYRGTPWYRITSYKSIMENHESNGFENFDEKSLNFLNEYIRRTKDYIKRNNYRKVYPLIENNVDILNLEKQLKTVSLRKKDKPRDKIEEVKGLYKTIKEIVNYCSSESGTRHMIAKGVIYNVINNGWDSVCFLYRQTKEIDVYKDYQQYFVDTAINYVKSDREKFKYNCFVCERKMKNMNNDISFLNETGFDVARKPSHVWNFNNDVAICDLCKLVYSCLPAGFTYGYDKGIFINDNGTVERLLRTNRIIRDNILNVDERDIRSLTYRALVNAINKEHSSKVQYELQDVQIIRYENDKYRFNILSKDILKIIKGSAREINSLINAGYKESRNFFNIYDMTMKKILDSYNMFPLIHRLLMHRITESETITTYYHIGHIMNLNIINVNYLKGVEGMEKLKENKALIKNYRTYGYYLREEYIKKDKDAEKGKIRGISYRLLNALKTRNTEMFMHNIITSYMYIGKTIPSRLTLALEDEEQLGIVGYAFVTGLNGWSADKNKENGGEINEG